VKIFSVLLNTNVRAVLIILSHISMEKPYTQADHIAKLIKTANDLGIKTYIATSQVELWDNPRYDEFFK